MDFTKEKIDFYLLDTHIENIFINEYMPLADGNYVKVYLFALMYADQNDTMSNDTIAKHLNMEIEDVLKAWNYWEKQGIIKKEYKSASNPFDYAVRFVSLKQLFASRNNKPAVTDGQKKKYIAKDVTAIAHSTEIKEMFNHLQSIAGRPFEGNETFEILEWLDNYKMHPDLIIQAYSYCVEKKNTNSFKYISSIIRSWKDKGIQTLQDLEKHLEETDTRYVMYKRILRALGLNFRYPTEEEKRIIDVWFDEWNFDLPTILEACKKTSGISNPNINYINSILKNWSQKGDAKPASKPDTPSAGKPRNVFEEYEKIRNKNEAIYESRRYEIYEKIPKIKIIDEEISKASISISKAVLMPSNDSEKSIDNIKKKIRKLNQEKAFLLTENNYPADYLDMIYQCSACKDTGLLEDGKQCNCLFNE